MSRVTRAFVLFVAGRFFVVGLAAMVKGAYKAAAGGGARAIRLLYRWNRLVRKPLCTASAACRHAPQSDIRSEAVSCTLPRLAGKGSDTCDRSDARARLRSGRRSPCGLVMPMFNWSGDRSVGPWSCGGQHDWDRASRKVALSDRHCRHHRHRFRLTSAWDWASLG